MLTNTTGVKFAAEVLAIERRFINTGSYIEEKRGVTCAGKFLAEQVT